MKSAVMIVVAGLLAGPLMASAANTVTGSVAEVRDDAIVVKQGKRKMEIGRDPGTTVSGDLKKGAKVAVSYRMTATSIDVKGGPREARGKK